MSRVPLKHLLAVGSVSLAFMLACGPLGGDEPKVEHIGSKNPNASRSGGSPSHSSGSGSSGGASALDPVDSNVDCDDNLGTKRGASCAIDRIACGDTIMASTQGQKGHFDDAFYRAKFCTPRSADYEDSPEAVYALTVPANMQADITLLSPCTDLDLFSIRWGSADRCPSQSTSTGECEGSTKGSKDTVRIVSVGRDEEHLVWVDGKKGNTGNFELHVECRPAR